MSTKRSDETMSSDGTDELFEDAVDTLCQIGDAISSPKPKGINKTGHPTKSLKCPPPGPPPPLPFHLVSPVNSPTSAVLLPTSPTSPVPPPLPPRKPLANSNAVPLQSVNVIVSSPSSPPPLPPLQSVSAPSMVTSHSLPMPSNCSDENTDNANNTKHGNGGGTNSDKELLHVPSEQSISTTMSTSNANTPAESASVMASNSAGTTAANVPFYPSTATDAKNVYSEQQQQSQFGRLRGHAKTNSLDRGLSLAKSMKTGPFPPPVVASKSNSLTRGASPIEALPILDEQDQSASTVIQSVLQQVLSEDISFAANNDDKDGEEDTKKQNGDVPHEQKELKEDNNSKKADHETDTEMSSTNIVVHYENLVDSSATAPPRPPQPCHGTSPTHHKFTANITTNTNNINNSKSFVSANNTSPKHAPSRSSQSEVLSILTRKQQQQKTLQLSANKKFHRRSASDRSPAKLDKLPQCKSPRPTHQKSSTWEPHQAQQQHKLLLGGGEQQQLNTKYLLDMMDPITRDVERRMSMKAKEAEAKAAKSNSDVNNESADDDDDVFGSHQHRHTGLDHVRRFARSYGVGAVDFFRGAVRKAKQIPEHLTRNVSMSRATKKSEIIAGENEDGASSIADSDIDQLSIAAAASEPNAATPTIATPSTSAGTATRKWRFGSAEPPRGNTPSVSTPPTTSAAATSSTQGQAMNSSAPSSSAPFARTGVCRSKNAKKGPFDFENLALVQEMNNEHTGAVWCVKFSGCGRLLATAGQDRNVRVWVLHSQLKHFAVSHDSATVPSSSPPSPVPSSSASSSFSSSAAPSNAAVGLLSNGTNTEQQQKTVNGGTNNNNNNVDSSTQSSPSKPSPASAVFAPKPLCVFRGHTADVLDLSWSPRNYFLLSSGMDRTAKLWHLHRNECLCSFQHIDFVTCLAFLPKDDRYFISGSLDGKIRLWHIPEKKVAIWNEVEQVNKFITAMTFVKNGKFVVIGTFLGRCFFYSTDQLKYHTVIDVRSSRGKNSVGHKITSLAVHGDKLLVASDDSRIRIYDLRDMDLCCKFKGAQISQSLIRAAFSPDGSHVISGSEDAHIYLWRTGPLPSSLGVRKDRNHAWERIRAHQSAVITAVFAPKPQLVLKRLADQQHKLGSASPPGLSSLFHAPGVSSAAVSAPAHCPATHSSAVALPQHNSSASSACASLMMLFPSISLSSATSHQPIAEAATANGSARSRTSRNVSGDVVVSADLTGSLKVFVSQ
ncbi:hypothetical protein niasHT_027655 [Heterodera trifolii]|uniref:WD repeat-containing protein 44 n=1 Tax=Heterodera trifolii TaxID=157864 RepID=A0ABD2K5U6_9BILA